MTCPNVVTLDGTKLMGNGFLSGDSPPPPLERMETSFGATPASQSPRLAALEAEGAALARLAEALEAAEEAAARRTEAEAHLCGAVHDADAELEEVTPQDEMFCLHLRFHDADAELEEASPARPQP
eukprot:666353-Pyramimonas_sp.AAC.1